MADESGKLPKQYLDLAGRPMLWHALHALCATPQIVRVFVVLAAADEFWCDADYADFATKLEVLRCGGSTRALSVSNGLQQIRERLPGDGLRVLVHDAARPCLTPALVEHLIRAVGDSESGGLLALPVADTLKSATGINTQTVAATVPRDGLWQAQTPQLFPLAVLLKALEGAPEVTDESSAIEALGLSPQLVESESTNFKVTYPRDLALAELILSSRKISPVPAQ